MIDAGLTWIGPPPQAIRDLGDKVTARHIAQRAGAPLVPGTADPVTGADEVVAFAEEHGLPVAIKAAFGGGGRGLKVARTIEEIPDLYESAVREAVAAFGRGECFVERYLDQPRHVETQVLADQHGNVVVVGTRDCSLQRRHQKLVEEAPAPFLTDEQRSAHPRQRRRRSAGRPATTAPARASSSSAGRHDLASSRSTPACRSSTRSPRRSPASTWSASSSASPTARSSATTTRRRAATPSSSASTARTRAAASCPPPARVDRTANLPAGPGVRVDSGVAAGDVIGGNFDSLLAKLIVTGDEPRSEALERARRALDEFEVDGMATALPFHRAVVRDPAFAPPTRQAVHRAHPVDRDRVRQHDPAVRRRRRRRRVRGRAARDGRRRGRRQAARGRRCPRASARSTGGGAGGKAAPKRAAGARRPAAAPPATR